MHDGKFAAGVYCLRRLCYTVKYGMKEKKGWKTKHDETQWMDQL